MNDFEQKFKPLILASQSLTRKEMLTKAGLDFLCLAPQESVEKEAKRKLTSMNIEGKEVSLFLARAKALSFDSTSSYIVASDQVCEAPDRSWINKPSSRREALSQLILLCGKTHYLYTSAVLYHEGKEIWKTVQEVELTMKTLSKEFLEKYLQNLPDEQLFSSGVYCIEKEGHILFNKIEGDYFSILGFPLSPFLSFITHTDKS